MLQLLSFKRSSVAFKVVTLLFSHYFIYLCHTDQLSLLVGYTFVNYRVIRQLVRTIQFYLSESCCLWLTTAVLDLRPPQYIIIILCFFFLLKLSFISDWSSSNLHVSLPNDRCHHHSHFPCLPVDDLVSLDANVGWLQSHSRARLYCLFVTGDVSPFHLYFPTLSSASYSFIWQQHHAGPKGKATSHTHIHTHTLKVVNTAIFF